MDYRDRWELKDYLIGRTLERRILLLHLGVVLLLLVFLFDFWYLQGVRAEQYSILAENNLRRRIVMMPTRGEIYDRNLGPGGINLPRESGRNALWAGAPCTDCPKGGQIYSAPLR